MAWSASAIFRPFVADVLDNTAALDLGADTIRAALYNNSITPDNDVTAANSAYDAGQWANTNEVDDDGNGWAAGGEALTSQTVDSGTADVVFFDADNTASSTSSVTLSDVHGCLVYDDTLTTPVADQGICYNYLGGANSVTSGTFTIVWNANGILRFTL